MLCDYTKQFQAITVLIVIKLEISLYITKNQTECTFTYSKIRADSSFDKGTPTEHTSGYTAWIRIR